MISRRRSISPTACWCCPRRRASAARLIDIDLPRPRDRSETRFVRYREELLREFGLH